MQFQTKYDRTPYKGEKNSGELLTEQAGYVPADVKILNMIEAGERLRDSRLGYEFEDEQSVPDDYYDPTRESGFDMADATALTAEALQRMAISQKKQEIPDQPETPKTPVTDEVTEKA